MGYSVIFLIICFLSVLEIEASSIVDNDLPPNQPYRTAFHFQPTKNWMNDPNGPMIHEGIYHLFYQYNPQGPIWDTKIAWGHSTSEDLLNWTPHPIALHPTSPQADINGCWSGSITILPCGTPVILYTGINQENEQVQNLAIPKNLSDSYLTESIKSPFNPLLSPSIANNINATLFRDPTTSWLGHDGLWRMIIGNENRRNGTALLHRSEDFVEWTKAEDPLFSTEGTGMWECPDFYPVSSMSIDGMDTSMAGDGIKHVLKVSLYDGFLDVYAIGRYDIEKDEFALEKGSLKIGSEMRYDYGKFYASKSFFDSSTERRILWGWVNESTNASVDIMKGWSGLQAIPRRVWLDESGKQFVQWPIEEIENLRENKVISRSIVLEGGSVHEVIGVTASQADVEISFEISSTWENAEELDLSWTNPQAICSENGAAVKGGIGLFGLLVLASEDIQEYTAIFFRIFRRQNRYVALMCSDQTRSSLHLDYDKPIYGAFVDVDPTKEKLSLRTLIDHSIVESFGGKGKACITARVYPSLAINGEAHLYAFNNGTERIKISKLTAWSMNKTQINSL